MNLRRGDNDHAACFAVLDNYQALPPFVVVGEGAKPFSAGSARSDFHEGWDKGAAAYNPVSGGVNTSAGSVGDYCSAVLTCVAQHQRNNWRSITLDL